MPYIKTEYANIFYLLHTCPHGNKSKVIVLIHGAGGSHLSMLSVFDYIKKKYRKNFNVLILDLPFHFRSINEKDGAGTNINIPVSKGIQYYADTINDIITMLFNENTALILIGHSMGAQISLEYASLYPSKTDRVMLIAGCDNIYIADGFIKSLEKSFDKTIQIFLKDAYSTCDKNILQNAMNDMLRTLPEITINDFKYVKYFSGGFKENAIGNINRHNIFFDLVYSKKDRIIKYKCIKDLNEKLNNSSINKIESKNHIELLFKNYTLEREIDKFLLT